MVSRLALDSFLIALYVLVDDWCKHRTLRSPVVVVARSCSLGRVFGNLYGAIGVADGLSYVLGGFLLDLTSPRATFVVAGVGGLLVTIATALALPRAMKATVTRTATLVERADTDADTD